MGVKVDGRAARGERTRQRILGALLELVMEGRPRPSGPEMAERAGVALRTIAYSFPTRESLMQAAARAFLARSQQVGEGERWDGPRGDRVRRYVAMRADYLEETAQIRRAGALDERSSPALAEAARLERLNRRKLAGTAFAPELVSRRGAQREVLLDALDLLSSGVVWDELRFRLGRSTAATLRVLEAKVEASLA